MNLFAIQHRLPSGPTPDTRAAEAAATMQTFKPLVSEPRNAQARQ
jgi:hypothetical protein